MGHGNGVGYYTWGEKKGETGAMGLSGRASPERNFKLASSFITRALNQQIFTCFNSNLFPLTLIIVIKEFPVPYLSKYVVL